MRANRQTFHLLTVLFQTSAQCIGSINSNQFLNPPCQQQQLVPTCNQQSQLVTVQPAQQLLPQLLPFQENLCAATQQPVYATTIVDNSVSNALANALQLLIVSDLIESTLSARNIEVAPCGVAETDLYGQYDAYPVQEVISQCSYPVQELVQSYAPVQAYAPPLAAEVVFPSSIPAQLTCNFGYVPSAQPVVQVVGIEPLSSYPSCGCGPAQYFY